MSRTIGNAIRMDRVAHAFLFTGARGVGKTTTARLLAKALNCEKGPSAEPCNACDACAEIAQGVDLDVLEMDGASNNSVDDVRRLQETLPFRPARDRYKIVIVDEVHMLSTGAFNAFLKTLEEPPSHVKFIFATTEIHKVPITIRSRCQRYDFRLIPLPIIEARIGDILQREGITADAAALTIVAREAAGSMRDALTLLDQLLALGGDGLRGEDVAIGLGIADRQSVFLIAEAVLTGDARQCLLSTRALGDKGLDILHFTKQLVELLRDLVVMKVAGDDPGLLEIPAHERESAQAIVNAHSSAELERAFFALSQLVDQIGQTSSPMMTLEMGLVRLAERPALAPVGELLAKLQALETRLGKGGGPSGGPGNPGGFPRSPAQSGGGSTPSRGGPPPASPPRAAPYVASAPKPAAAPIEAPAPVTPSFSSAIAAAITATPQHVPVAAPAAAPLAAAEATHASDAVNDAPTFATTGVPGTWADIVGRIKSAQPALAAILEHGVALDVGPTKIRLGFPPGSFFGRQAGAPASKEAVVNAAHAVLGARPIFEVTVSDAAVAPADGSAPAAQTLAQAEAIARKERKERKISEAMEHPKVQAALEVFPEAKGHVDVRVELD